MLGVLTGVRDGSDSGVLAAAAAQGVAQEVLWPRLQLLWGCWSLPNPLVAPSPLCPGAGSISSPSSRQVTQLCWAVHGGTGCTQGAPCPAVPPLLPTLLLH